MEEQTRRGLVSYLHEVLPSYLECLTKGSYFQDISSIISLTTSIQTCDLSSISNEKDQLRRLDGKENVTAPLLLLSFCEENLDKIYSDKYLISSVRDLYVMVNDDISIILHLCKRFNDFRNDSKSSYKRVRRKMISANASSGNNHVAVSNELSVTEIVIGLLSDLLSWINLRIAYIDAVNEFKLEGAGLQLLSNNYSLGNSINKALASTDLLYTDKLVGLIDDTAHSLDIILAFIVCKNSLFTSYYVNFVTDIFRFQQLRQQPRSLTVNTKDDVFTAWIASYSKWLVSAQSVFFEGNISKIRDHVQRIPSQMISTSIVDAVSRNIIQNKIVHLISSFASNKDSSCISMMLVSHGYNTDSKTYKAPSHKNWTYKIDHSMTRTPMNSAVVSGKNSPRWFPSYVFAIPSMSMNMIDDAMRCLHNSVDAAVVAEVEKSVEYKWISSNWNIIDVLLQNKYCKQITSSTGSGRVSTNEKSVAAPDSATMIGICPLYSIDSKVSSCIVITVSRGSDSASDTSKSQIEGLLKEVYSVLIASSC